MCNNLKTLLPVIFIPLALWNVYSNSSFVLPRFSSLEITLSPGLIFMESKIMLYSPPFFLRCWSCPISHKLSSSREHRRCLVLWPATIKFKNTAGNAYYWFCLTCRRSLIKNNCFGCPEKRRGVFDIGRACRQAVFCIAGSGKLYSAAKPVEQEGQVYLRRKLHNSFSCNLPISIK